MGLDVYLDEGEDLPLDEQEQPIPEEPDDDEHLFRRDYLRSSYNDGGFNRITQAKVGMDLWDVFGHCGDLESGVVTPTTEQLQMARKHAVEVYETLQESDKAYATFVGFNKFRNDDDYDIRNAEEALQAWYQTMDGRDDTGPFGMSAFSNAKGRFYPEPLEIKALLPGFGPLKTKGVWVIYDMDMDWYIEAARRVIVFIDTALTMNSPKITWSY